MQGHFPGGLFNVHSDFHGVLSVPENDPAHRAHITVVASPGECEVLQVDAAQLRSHAGEASRPRIVVVQHWFEELKRLAPAN